MSQQADTTIDGSVFTWGDGDEGKLGLGDVRSNKLVPTLVRGELQNKVVVQIGAGIDYSIRLATDGLVYTWGNNEEGKLGVADMGIADLPVLVQALDAKSAA